MRLIYYPALSLPIRSILPLSPSMHLIVISSERTYPIGRDVWSGSSTSPQFMCPILTYKYHKCRSTYPSRYPWLYGQGHLQLSIECLVTPTPTESSWPALGWPLVEHPFQKVPSSVVCDVTT